MRKVNIRPVKGPEAKIQADIKKFLEDRKWFVKNMHGNMYQSGIPDLYACRRKFFYGTGKSTWDDTSKPLTRWIEVKYGEKYKFTPAQLRDFPKFTAEGVGIWVMVAATEAEYRKLFQPPNWWQYLQAAQA
jgi:hypothetical protein